jgi:hypothetical protein
MGDPVSAGAALLRATRLPCAVAAAVAGRAEAAVAWPSQAGASDDGAAACSNQSPFAGPGAPSPLRDPLSCATSVSPDDASPHSLDKTQPQDGGRVTFDRTDDGRQAHPRCTLSPCRHHGSQRDGDDAVAGWSLLEREASLAILTVHAT